MADVEDEPTVVAPVSNRDCRFYENKYPAAEQLVVVQVTSVTQLGAYVNLLEYGNIQGMILLSELSRRRIRSINKLIRVGRIEIVAVIRVDEEKGYIDLSKRRVSQEDIAAADDRYNKSKAVHSIMRHVSERNSIPMIELYQLFGWDLYKRYGHAYAAFARIVEDAESVLGQYNIPEAAKNDLCATIRLKLTPQPVKIRADVEATCFGYEGIDAIKNAFRAAQALTDEKKEMTINIHLIAPPLYVMQTTSLDEEAGIALLNQACDSMSEILTKADGCLNIKTAPRAVNKEDDKQLSKLMADLEKRNAEVAGDDED